MRTVSYERLEFHQDGPEQREAPLAEFVLDVPYLVMFGVIPPLHVLNEVLSGGGGDAGMSPGARWDPFAIDDDEYSELVAGLLALDLRDVAASDRARFVPDALIVDHGAADSRNHLEWMARITAKYGPDAGSEVT